MHCAVHTWHGVLRVHNLDQGCQGCQWCCNPGWVTVPVSWEVTQWVGRDSRGVGEQVWLPAAATCEHACASTAVWVVKLSSQHGAVACRQFRLLPHVIVCCRPQLSQWTVLPFDASRI